MATVGKSVDKELIRTVKSLLWMGKAQSTVSAMTGVSQGTVSRIKNGYVHGDVPWPDGSVGRMPVREVLVEVDWSADAKRLLCFPDDMQMRIFHLVNERRTATGLPPIPDMAPEYRDYLNADEADREWEATTLVEARKAEDKRLATIMLEFDELVASEEATKRAEELTSIFSATSEGGHPAERPPRPPKQLKYEKLDWPYILRYGRTVDVVRDCMSCRDAVLREAICIVFFQFKDSQTNWRSSVVEDQVREIAEKLRADPMIVQQIEAEAAEDGFTV